jgi:hypothetical protein
MLNSVSRVVVVERFVHHTLLIRHITGAYCWDIKIVRAFLKFVT